jgi:FtsH-binding integral membrane protein
MTSVLPTVLVGLIITGIVAAVGFLVTLRAPGGPTPIDAATKLVWSLYFVIHAVFVLLMSESRDVSPLLSTTALCAGVLMFACAVAALVACLVFERRARSPR